MFVVYKRGGEKMRPSGLMWGKIGIYVIINNLSGKKYVGQSTNIQRRWYNHRSKSMHPRKPDEFRNLLYQDIRKYGLENFSIEILEECEKEQLKEKEIYWIDKLDTFNNGYNNTPGGNVPCESQAHHLTDHGRARLTIGEVEMCRIAYRDGKSSREIYEKYFKDKITYDGFSRMWHGKNWKEVMPEVFEHNPRPAKKINPEDVLEIRKRFDAGEGCRQLVKDYEGKISYTSIYGIAHRQTYKDGIHYKSDVSTSSSERKPVIDTQVETDILSAN